MTQVPNAKLRNIAIDGYRSIKHCSVDLRDVNVLIGPNGAGKSNFISAFSLIQKILTNNLQITAAKCGPSSLFYNGIKATKSFEIKLTFDNNAYGFSLEPTYDGKVVFSDEYFEWNKSGKFGIGRGHFESKWRDGVRNGIDNYVRPVLAAQSWRVYHFNDTSRTSEMKQPHEIHDNTFLHQDAGNIAPFLMRLLYEYPKQYRKIVFAIRMVAPFFDDFVLIPNNENETVTLRWKRKGHDDVMGPNQFSDGTLRFICFSALLLQPDSLKPETIILDEPELGLYPQAMVYLAEMIHTASVTKQIIISTQSVDLLDEFSSDDVIIVEDKGNGTEFRRINSEKLKRWLEDDYTLGTLWKKNILSGDG